MAPGLSNQPWRGLESEDGEMTFLPCSCFLPTRPSHLLACSGVSWRRFMIEQKRIFKLLVRRGILDLVQAFLHQGDKQQQQVKFGVRVLLPHHICMLFKHNTSFVSRLSTIRRHKSTPSHGHPPHARGRFDSTASTDFVAPSKTPSGGTYVDDATGKDVSDNSKRNSDECIVECSDVTTTPKGLCNMLQKEFSCPPYVALSPAFLSSEQTSPEITLNVSTVFIFVCGKSSDPPRNSRGGPYANGLPENRVSFFLRKIMERKGPPNRFPHVKFIRFRIRLNSWTQYRFPIADRDSDRSQISSVQIPPYFVGLPVVFPLKEPHKSSLKNSVSRWRSFTTASLNPIFFSSGALTPLIYLSP
ncbi:potassium voltage-gated channel subfamily KQT member 5 [Trichonephila clavipes]|nr:potassium voltage-gated channel subfamily KQT member 5 [Trichonephila clavipes]